MLPSNPFSGHYRSIPQLIHPMLTANSTRFDCKSAHACRLSDSITLLVRSKQTCHEIDWAHHCLFSRFSESLETVWVATNLTQRMLHIMSATNVKDSDLMRSWAYSKKKNECYESESSVVKTDMEHLSLKIILDQKSEEHSPRTFLFFLQTISLFSTYAHSLYWYNPYRAHLRIQLLFMLNVPPPPAHTYW